MERGIEWHTNPARGSRERLEMRTVLATLRTTLRAQLIAGAFCFAGRRGRVLSDGGGQSQAKCAVPRRAVPGRAGPRGRVPQPSPFRTHGPRARGAGPRAATRLAARRFLTVSDRRAPVRPDVCRDARAHSARAKLRTRPVQRAWRDRGAFENGLSAVRSGRRGGYRD